MVQRQPEPHLPPLSILSEEERLFAASVREFAEAEIRPYVRQMDAEGRLRPEIISKCFELGLMAIEPPETYGGSGGTFFMACLAIEELARVDASVSVFVDVNNTLVLNALMQWGTEEQKLKYGPRLATDTVAAYALSEAGSGSDAFALQTKAVDKGDHYLLNGRKLWITNSLEAGLFLLFANAQPEKATRGYRIYRGKGIPGFSVGHKDKLSIGLPRRVSSSWKIVASRRENVLGEFGKGYKIAIRLNEGRIGIGAQMPVGAGRLRMRACVYERAQAIPDRRSQISERSVQLAEMATEIEAVRLMVYNAARLKDAGQPFIKQAAMAKPGISCRRARRLDGTRAVRRLRVHKGLSRRKILP
jgi:alkylation response protein AidB-like acyl-CoA dehydrogenase